MSKPKTTETILQLGATTEFWHILCTELDKDILRFQRERDNDQMASMPAIEYKLAMENIKDKIRLLEDLKRKPQTIIQNLDNEEEEEEMDPYK